MSVPRSLSLPCPAKINIHLRVAPPRVDGFHPLMSWMCTVGLFDTLAFETLDEAPSAHNAPFTLTSDAPGLPSDDGNLIVRVAKAWSDSPMGKGRPFPTAIRAALVKSIPVGAGLGGGSSDAAAAIVGLARLTQAPGEPSAADALRSDAVREFAARFGSDVPFFLFGPSAACTGRGEIIRRIPRPRPAWALLVLPPVMMPTATVYRTFDALGLGDAGVVAAEPDWAAWASMRALDLLPLLVNDLEAAAFAVRPDLGALRAQVEQAIGRVVRMSGSGSSLFSLFDDRAEAEAASRVAGAIQAPMPSRVEVVELAPEAQS